MVDVGLELCQSCINLDFVLPFVLGPLLLEIQLTALCLLEVIHKVNIDLINVQN